MQLCAPYQQKGYEAQTYSVDSLTIRVWHQNQVQKRVWELDRRSLIQVRRWLIVEQGYIREEFSDEHLLALGIEELSWYADIGLFWKIKFMNFPNSPHKIPNFDNNIKILINQWKLKKWNEIKITLPKWFSMKNPWKIHLTKLGKVENGGIWKNSTC